MLSLSTKLSSVRGHFQCYGRAAVCARQAKRVNSTTTSASSHQPDSRFPYPTNRNPTPYQIFHLPRNASESDIKARYFDLVRLYHPDKAGLSVSPEVAHAQFQAITAAYDALRGKTPLGSVPGSASGAVDSTYQSTAAWRAMRNRRQELYSSGAADDSWKDKIIVMGVVGTILIVVYETTTTRREALAEAVARSRNYGAYKEYQQPREDDRLAQPTSHQEAIPKS